MPEIVLYMCVIILLVDVISAQAVPIYNEQDICGTVIQLGGTRQAARLMYRYSPVSSQPICNVTIGTSGDNYIGTGSFQIAYAFLDSVAENNFKCSSKIYIDNGHNTEEFCGSNVYPKDTRVTRENRLFISVAGDGRLAFAFDLLLLLFHKGSCATYETRCNGLLGDPNSGSACVDYNLVCHETYTFCQSTSGQCGDIVKDGGANSTLIAVISVTLIAVLLVGVGCFICYRKNLCGFLKRNSEEEREIRTRATNVFSLQLANRGVDGNDNTAYTDDEGNPIDFSKFDPPPEYGSLEHLESVGTTETDGNASPKEALPSYDDVMDNFDSYSVTTQI